MGNFQIARRMKFLFQGKTKIYRIKHLAYGLEKEVVYGGQGIFYKKENWGTRVLFSKRYFFRNKNWGGENDLYENHFA